MGLLFQIPIAILSLTRLGIVTPTSWPSNRRYAILVIAVVSAAAPGGDPVSMILIMVPLLAALRGQRRPRPPLRRSPTERLGPGLDRRADGSTPDGRRAPMPMI